MGNYDCMITVVSGLIIIVLVILLYIEFIICILFPEILASLWYGNIRRNRFRELFLKPSMKINCPCFKKTH